ncbi:MAG: hypothetical protein RJQ08_10805 [Salinisphaeraceae bacterium]
MRKVSTQGLRHDGIHPFEIEAADYTRTLLGYQNWPFERMTISLSFMMRARSPSSSNTRKLKLSNGSPNGEVQLWFNHLFLMQRPGVFLKEVVPHELAHVMTEASAMKQGRKPDALHGQDYNHMHRALVSHEPKSHGALLDLFDNRAIMLADKHKPGRCDCKGYKGFHVLSPSQQNRVEHEKEICSECESPVRFATDKALPPDVSRDLDYINWFKDEERKASK